MACANCGAGGLSIPNRLPRASHQPENMTSLVQPLLFDNTVTVLQGLEDLFDLNIDIDKELSNLKGMMPQLCEFCTYILAQAHQARKIFLRKSQVNSFVAQLISRGVDQEHSKYGRPNVKQKRKIHDIEEEGDQDFDTNVTVKQERIDVHNYDNPNSDDDNEMEDACGEDNRVPVFECSECRKSFPSSLSLERHIRSSHDVEFDPDMDESSFASGSNTSDEEESPHKKLRGQAGSESEGDPGISHGSTGDRNEIEVSKSRKNRDLLILNGYRFVESKPTRLESAAQPNSAQSNRRYWNCFKKHDKLLKCRARIQTLGNNDMIQLDTTEKNNTRHNHKLIITRPKRKLKTLTSEESTILSDSFIQNTSAEYEEVPNGTEVWKYFLRHVDKQTAKCKFRGCKKVLKNKGTTSCLYTHLRSLHNIT